MRGTISSMSVVGASGHYDPLSDAAQGLVGAVSAINNSSVDSIDLDGLITATPAYASNAVLPNAKGPGTGWAR